MVHFLLKAQSVALSRVSCGDSRASDRSHIHFDWNGGRCAGADTDREGRMQAGSIRLDLMSPRGRPSIANAPRVRLGVVSYGPVNDDTCARQNGRFSVHTLREGLTSDRSICRGAALSKSRSQRQQDRQAVPTNARNAAPPHRTLIP